eukprot:6146656-Prymnesium_polylepis.3
MASHHEQLAARTPADSKCFWTKPPVCNNPTKYKRYVESLRGKRSADYKYNTIQYKALSGGRVCPHAPSSYKERTRWRGACDDVSPH